MNSHPINSSDQDFADRDPLEQQLMADANLELPASLAPDISELHERVSVVRRNRKIMRGVNVALATCLIATCGFVVLDRYRSNQPLPGAPSPSQIAVELPLRNDAVSEPQRSNGELQDLPRKSDRFNDRSPRIQLYARYVEPMPVFDIDQEKQEVHHVGWVESERTIPVDMKYVPTDQQETFNAMLSGDAWNISL